MTFQKLYGAQLNTAKDEHLISRSSMDNTFRWCGNVQTKGTAPTVLFFWKKRMVLAMFKEKKHLVFLFEKKKKRKERITWICNQLIEPTASQRDSIRFYFLKLEPVYFRSVSTCHNQWYVLHHRQGTEEETERNFFSGIRVAMIWGNQT